MFKNPNSQLDISYARFFRKKRAEIKKNLKKNLITLNEILVNNEYKKFIEGMYLYDIIISMPGFGLVKTNMVLKKLKINKCKKLKGLGPRQKQAFIKYFNLDI